MTEQEYFADTSAISNSQLRNYISYNDYWDPIKTPDIYRAYHIDKAMKFEVNDAMIVWKVVDKYFDWTWEKVWEEYEIVSRRTWKSDKIEITKTMWDDINKLIKWGNYFPKFQEFIKDKDTKAQTSLFKEVELTSKTWEVKKVKLKWLPDFINNKKKVIVDLKTTTWEISRITDGMAFKWKPKLTANYLRQLALYNFLSWWDYDGVISLLSPKWIKWIDVPNSILIDTWEIMKEDIIDLANFIEKPDNVEESIFYEEDELSL